MAESACPEYHRRRTPHFEVFSKVLILKEKRVEFFPPDPQKTGRGLQGLLSISLEFQRTPVRLPGLGRPRFSSATFSFQRRPDHQDVFAARTVDLPALGQLRQRPGNGPFVTFTQFRQQCRRPVLAQDVTDIPKLVGEAVRREKEDRRRLMHDRRGKSLPPTPLFRRQKAHEDGR